MTIAISGASGFIGSSITKYLQQEGDVVVPIDRQLLLPQNVKKLVALVGRCDVVINLNGASLNHRWSNSYKKEILDSRVHSTRRLVAAINSAETKPKLLLSASAIGIYNAFGVHSESSTDFGDSFLSGVCRKWEHEAMEVDENVRLVLMRFGVVVSDKGGALQKMIAVAKKYSMTPVVGDGAQPFSWIAIEDLVSAVHFVMTRKKIRGVVNFVSPSVGTNRGLMTLLRQKYSAKFQPVISKIVLVLVLGEMAQLLTEGQSVCPEKLLANGFVFKHKTLPALISGLDGC